MEIEGDCDELDPLRGVNQRGEAPADAKQEQR
jgi:hypothetical protein